MSALLRWISHHPVVAGVSAVAVAVVAFLVLDSPRLTPEDAEVVLDWLTCEECIDGELQRVRDLGSRAEPILEAFLVDPPQAYLQRMGAAAAPGSNLRATTHQRAIRALVELGAYGVIEDAYAARDALAYRADVVAHLQDALGAAGLGATDFPAPAAVFLRPDNVGLTPGGEVTLEAIVQSDSGRTMSYQTIAWSSDDEAVATVSVPEPAVAAVTANGDGTTRVRAAVAGVEGVATVTVGPAPAAAPGRIELVSGSAQADSVGRVLGESLVVRVLASDGAELSGVDVLFQVTRGSATVDVPANPPQLVVPTGPSGTAAITLRLGLTPGPVWVEARVLGGGVFRPSAVRFQLMARP